MKVKAKHWIKTESGWHQTGEVFETDTVDGLTGMVDVIEEDSAPVGQMDDSLEPEEEKPAARKRGRKNTTN